MQQPQLLLEDRRHYAYAHIRGQRMGKGGMPFYIGKGHNGRAFDMYDRSNWHRSVTAKHGADVLILKRYLTDSEAKALEVKTIADCKKAGIKLVNMTAGGDGRHGSRISKETRLKLSATSKANMARPDVKQKIQDSLKATNSLPDVKAKRSASAKEANNRPEVREKKSVGLKKAYSGQEIRAKCSVRSKKMWERDSHRKNISQAMRSHRENPAVKQYSSEKMKSVKSVFKAYCAEHGISRPGKGYCKIDKAHFNQWRLVNKL